MNKIINFIGEFLVNWTMCWLGLFVGIIGILIFTLYVPQNLVVWYMKKANGSKRVREVINEKFSE